jgi:hypothetical protein
MLLFFFFLFFCPLDNTVDGFLIPPHVEEASDMHPN